MTIEGRLLKSAALVAIAVLGSACTLGKTGAEGSPSDGPVERRGPASSGDVSDGKPAAKPKAAEGAPDGTERKPIAPKVAGARPERPWAHNTGPSNPAALTPSPSLKVKTDGVVLENLDITGRVKIDASNVTLRNFRIDATGTSYGILIEDGHSGILLEDGEILNMKSSGILAYSDFTARRLHIHDSGADGLKVQGGSGPTVIESCFIEKLGRNPTSHADGNQTRGGSNITFRYNNIYMPAPGTPNYPGEPYKSNATFMLELDISNFVIEHNWLTGGNYTIYCPRKGGVSVRNNVFGRDNAGLPVGKDAVRVRAGNCEQWSGNRWEDTGNPI